MTLVDRRVRHLRLRAGSQADVGRVLHVLEDALRCASLPDTSSRLLLVRRLALGRIARDATAQALAQLIERRVAAVGGQWVEGGSAAAAGAAYVSFAGALEARVRLALRLVRGEPHAEWYWPLAVPELRAAQSRHDALRRIAGAIAQWPEARTALPAWVAALVQAGQGGRLAAAIGTTEGEALVRQVGLAMSAAAAGTLAPLPGLHAHAAPQEKERASDGPRWMQCLLDTLPGRAVHPGRRAAQPVDAPGAALPPERSAKATGPVGHGASLPGAPQPPSEPAVAEGPVTPAPDLLRRAPTLQRPVAGRQAGIDSLRTGPATARLVAQPLAGEPEEDMEEALEMDLGGMGPTPSLPLPCHPFDPRPTAFAGLLFLLPVLERLGLAQWLDQVPDTGFAQRVLHQGLWRLQAPADDPAWAVATFEPADGPALPGPAPACWGDPVLAAVPSLPQALAARRCADAQAAVWLTAARRWLRRAGRIGLASLVRRPGFISLTATHADLHFHLQATDLRVRRLGLDLDPGWLPWFGHVVAFHYHRTLP